VSRHGFRRHPPPRGQAGASEWRVEYVGEDGGCFVSIFAGPRAEERARDLFRSPADRNVAQLSVRQLKGWPRPHVVDVGREIGAGSHGGERPNLAAPRCGHAMTDDRAVGCSELPMRAESLGYYPTRLPTEAVRRLWTSSPSHGLPPQPRQWEVKKPSKCVGAAR